MEISLDKIVEEFKKSHPNIKNEDEAIKFYQDTYSKTDMGSNECAWHFTAFRMAFLDYCDD